MPKRLTMRMTLLVIATLVVGLVAPTGASAQAQRRITVRGETTTLTTAPGLVKKLLGAKIVALVTAPGTQSLVSTRSGPALVARYPVTSGTVGLKPLRGSYGHRGGLFVTNLNNGKSIAVDNFVVNITKKILTAHLVGAKPSVRLTVFKLNFSRAALVVRKGFIRVSRIGVSLDPSAASALNGVLGTTAFKGGMAFGTASSRLDR